MLMGTASIATTRSLLCTIALWAPVSTSAQNSPPSAAALRIAAASTVSESGLVSWLAEGFESANPGIKVSAAYAGAMAVFDRARAGLADLVIAHHPDSEALFVGEGYGVLRTIFMYNEFALFGPPDDPLRLRAITDVRPVFRRLAQAQADFMAPGQRSGTFEKLSELWAIASVDPDWPGYQAMNASSATTLRAAAVFQAYAFADLGTYFAYRDEFAGRIVPLVRDNIALRNYYSAVVVNRERIAGANQPLAERFLNYLVSTEGQERIRQHGEQRLQVATYTPAAHLDDGLRARRESAAWSEKSAQLTWAVLLAFVLAATTIVQGVMLVLKARRKES